MAGIIRKLCHGKRKFEEHKETYLNLSLTEKRKFYKCGENFKTLEDVTRWSKICKPVPQGLAASNSKYKVESDLNEKVGIFSGNIATLEVDAIVNPSNISLITGGGVDAIIHDAAGPDLHEECKTLKGCKIGEAKITGGYLLPAKYVIHTVGPHGEQPEMLKSCYLKSLQLAVENNLKVIAFPCISTGLFGYPNREAAVVVLETVRNFLETNRTNIDLIVFCLFEDSDKTIYHELLPQYFPC